MVNRSLLFRGRLRFWFLKITVVVCCRMQAGRQIVVQTRNSSGKLKELGIRLKSIRNIEKITKTMKMISSAKFAKSSKKIGPARAFGMGAQSIDAVSSKSHDVALTENSSCRAPREPRRKSSSLSPPIEVSAVPSTPPSAEKSKTTWPPPPPPRRSLSPSETRAESTSPPRYLSKFKATVPTNYSEP